MLLSNAPKPAEHCVLDVAYRSRLIFYSCLVALAGIAITILGAILNHVMGSSRMLPPAIFPPNVVSYSPMTIVTGVLELVYAMAGIAVAVAIPATQLHQHTGITKPAGGSMLGQKSTVSQTSRPLMVNMHVVIGLVLWLWLIGGHVLGQIGLLGGMAAGPAIAITVLSTSLVLMPAYLAGQASKEGSVIYWNNSN